MRSRILAPVVVVALVLVGLAIERAAAVDPAAPASDAPLVGQLLLRDAPVSDTPPVRHLVPDASIEPFAPATHAPVGRYQLGIDRGLFIIDTTNGAVYKDVLVDGKNKWRLINEGFKR